MLRHALLNMGGEVFSKQHFLFASLLLVIISLAGNIKICYLKVKVPGHDLLSKPLVFKS